MVNPRATNEDLTARARIRNAALDLYAEHGESRVSLRAVAAAAGVTLGLVQHHYKTKDGLRRAVDQLVVDYFAQAIAQAPADSDPTRYAAARDESVRHMLRENPTVVNYLRRAFLEPPEARNHLLEALIELTQNEVAKLRTAGLASTKRPESTQIVAVLVRQFGELLLQPMIDAAWERLPHLAKESKPTLSIAVNEG